MKNKLLLPILALLAVAVFFLWRAGLGGAVDLQEAPLGLAPGEVGAAGAADGTAALPAVPQETGAAPRREAVALAPRAEVDLAPGAAPPPDAIWLTGRVLFPDRMPNDMGAISVTARGRRFGDLDSRREHSVEAQRDGSFRVALARETRKGWLEARGRYLYMDEKLQVDVDDLPPEILLEPKLGGVVRGLLRAPRGRDWTEAARAGARVMLNSWSGGQSVSRSTEIDERGRFELTAVPPNNSYWLRFELPLWCDTSKSDVAVKSGEVTELDLEVQEGSTISGRVVNQDEAGLGGVTVELTGTPSDDSWMHDTLLTEADGSFLFRGVKDAQVTLKAVPREGLPVEQDLGHLSTGTRREGLLLRLREGDFVEGVVRWPNGTPAAAAWVSVSQERELDGLMFNFADAKSEKTDAEGRFRVTGLEPSVCQVRATAKSFRPEDLAKAKERAADGREYKLRARGPSYKTRLDDIQPGSSGLVLVLSEGDSLSGRVVDDQGQGLTRFLVTAEPLQGPGSDLEEEDAVNRIVVSLDGSFTVDGLQDGQWQVSAKAKGHEPTQEVLVTSPGAGSIELVARRFGEVAGVVRSPGGEPVSGARVFVESLAEGEEFQPEKVSRSWGENATSDQDGRFTARDVRPGRTRLSATAEGFGSSQGVLLQVAPGSELEGVALQLRRAARIRGRLHASVGVLAERQIQLRVEGGGNFWKSTETDSAGEFELDGLDAGTYRVTLENDREGPEAGAQRKVVEVVELDDGEQVTLLMGAPPAAPTTVSGRVLSGSAPAAGIVVGCRSSADGDLDNDSGRTDANGRYNLTLRGDGRYDFQVGNPQRGLVSHTRELIRGENPGVDFLLPTGRVSGTVLGLQGQALEDCDVTMVAVELADTANEQRPSRSLVTDETGHYEFDYVAAGRYYLRVNDRNSRSWRQRNRKQAGTQLREGLVVGEGASVEGVDFDLVLEGEVEGNVTGADGQPVEGAQIQVRTKSGQQVHRSRRVRTGAGGNFTYGGLAAGTFLVQASAGDSKSREVEVRVDSGGKSSVFLNLERD
jgi:hypothetical protein